MTATSAKTYWEGPVDEFCKEFPKAIEQAVATMTRHMQQQQDAEIAKLNRPAGQAKTKREAAWMMASTQQQK